MTSASPVRPLFAARVPDPVAGALIGIEQEFEVWRGDERIDFRHLIHALPIDGRRVDPGDTNAYRLPCGMALTCDEREAELASPPIETAQDFDQQLVAWGAHARATLSGLLGPAFTLRGYSTHISIALPGPPDAALAERYGRSFGPVFGLLIDRPDSLGIYVRPRPGRLELCGEFVEGRRLGAIAAFAVASVRAAAAGRFPAELDLELLPGRERFGHRVHRQALGFDLYAAGREALMPLKNGETRPVTDLLAEAMSMVRSEIGAGSADEGIAYLQSMVSGHAPLGVEEGIAAVEAPQSALPPPHSPHGLAARRWTTGTAGIEATLATWAFTLFRVSTPDRERYTLVPSGALVRFAERIELSPGLLAAEILATRPRTLSNVEQTREAGVFSALTETPADLLEPELPPADAAGTSIAKDRAGAARAGKVSRERSGKIVLLPLPARTAAAPPPMVPVSVPGPAPVVPPAAPSTPTTVPVPPAAGRPAWLTFAGVAAAVAAIAVAGVVVMAQGGGGEAGPDGTPTPMATSTAAPAFVGETATSTKSSTETATVMSTPSGTPVPSATATAAATETPVPATATLPPTATSTQTAAGATETPVSNATPTVRPTETPRPTLTPTRTPTPTSTASPTPTPTPIPTPVIDLPLPTPQPTPCVFIPGTTICR